MSGKPSTAGAITTLRRLARYLFLRPVIASASGLLLLVALVAQSVQPLLFGRAVNDLAEGNTDGIAGQAMLIIVLALTTWLLRWIAANLIAIAAQHAMRVIREELFEKMQTLSLGFHQSRSTGELMSRITSDTEVINTFLSSSLFGIASSVIQLVAVTIIMFAIDIPLAIVVILLAPVSVFLMTQVAKRAGRNFSSLQASVGEINGFLEESVTGQKTLQAYGQARPSLAELETLSERARDADRTATFLTFSVMPLVRLVSNSNVAGVALVGGIRVVRGATTVGSVVSFLGYSQQFAQPIGQISRSMNQAIQAAAGANRVFELLDEQPSIVDGADAAPIEHAEGDVVFDDVDFSYEAGKQILFDNSFHATPGQMIGLIGPTGAGKSTIINLIGRFYEIDDGEIRLDDQPLVTLAVDDLRLRAAVVLQTPFLFSESVMYNLKYGRTDATDEESIQAAKDANAHRFISRLPNGYDTVLAEGGNNLSQGQRQLITIARAIVARPDVLILDEATSSVDTRTERDIQVAMRRLMEDRTSFVIAHRLSTVRDADKIIALDNGEIQEIGTHDELLDKQGFYYGLFMEQFSKASLPGLQHPSPGLQHPSPGRAHPSPGRAHSSPGRLHQIFGGLTYLTIAIGERSFERIGDLRGIERCQRKHCPSANRCPVLHPGQNRWKSIHVTDRSKSSDCCLSTNRHVVLGGGSNERFDGLGLWGFPLAERPTGCFNNKVVPIGQPIDERDVLPVESQFDRTDTDITIFIGERANQNLVFQGLKALQTAQCEGTRVCIWPSLSLQDGGYVTVCLRDNELMSYRHRSVLINPQ